MLSLIETVCLKVFTDCSALQLLQQAALEARAMGTKCRLPTGPCPLPGNNQKVQRH